ncbi:MAG TPA: family 78 glycoside hydrolase catalytic domain [Armatimonadota bacterium]|jgi:hypothetical protein
MAHPFTQAQWIWTEGDPAPMNYYLAARREFDLEAAPASALLQITADSRYLLFVNGRRIGPGPNRCWPWDYQYDTREIAPYLHAGRNVIAVLITCWGTSNFQYILGRGGLLAQLEIGGTVIATDSSWRVRRHEAWARPTPRISCQQGWAEQYDAREEPAGWTSPGYDDSAWTPALAIGAPGREPWVELSPREIPFLSEEWVLPARVVSARVVQTPRLVRHFNLRPTVLDNDLTANNYPAEAALAMVLTVAEAGPVTLLQVGEARHVALNGELVEAKGKRIALDLKAGDNLLTLDVSGWRHDWSYVFGLESEQEVAVSAPLGGPEGAIANIAAFSRLAEAADPTAWSLPEKLSEGMADALSAASAEALADLSCDFVPVAPEHTSLVAVGAQTEWAQEVRCLPLASPLVQAPQALCAGSEDATVISPAPDGEVQLLIDFGRELTGYWELNLEAPAGAVLDLYGFEAMFNGHPQWMEMENTLRYTCREGHQTFLSPQRRGFRYVILTVRNLTAPLRLRGLRCLFSSNAATQRGNFYCSDDRLNRIWQMGVYTTRCCSEDTFVDCPSFEQTFWVGDARNEALINYLSFGDTRFVERCWRLVAGSLRRSDIPESQVPSGWQNLLPAWSALWAIGCAEHYAYSGNLAFQEEIYPAVATTLRNFLARRNGQGLLEIVAWNLLDWAPLDTPSEGVVTHNNGWLVRALHHGAQMADLLGRDEDAAEFRREADAVIAAINLHLWSEEQQAYVDCLHLDGSQSPVISQQTNTVLYLCDCVTPERLARVAGYVEEIPAEWVHIGSPFMLFFSFEAMVKLGRYELILEWTRRFWGMMLDADASTCWEMFPLEIPHTRSHCHAWSAGPTYFLSAYQLGVRPLEPGFRTALIAPEPAGLDWCRGRTPTPHGEIEVAWKQDDGWFRLDVALPEGVAARVVMPGSAEDYAPPTGGGAPVVVDGKWQMELPAGACVRLETSGSC